MEQRMSMNTRVRLSVMMLLQYMMFAVFWVPLAAYLTNMNVEGMYKATILSSMALGCLVAPLICMIADRHFSSQKVLTVLNFACGVLLLLAAKQTDPMMLFIFLVLAMFCYMPTWSLTNAIAMANSPAEKFPQIRVFGSIGWVASGLFSFVAGWKMFGETTIDGTNIPLLCGAGTALLAALVNTTLPDTPPPSKGKEASIVDALGLRALTLMKDFNFALFIIISMLVMIPFTIYWSYGSMFLQDQGFEFITITMNWGQFVEMFLMLLVPFALAKFGVKKTMLIGLAALLARYVSFWGGGTLNQNSLYFLGILVHGIIFGFFFVGGQVYVDKKAPPEIRAQAQGLIVLICFGMGMLIGNYGNGAMIDSYSAKLEPAVAGYTMPSAVPAEAVTVADAKVSDVKLYGRALSATEVAVLNMRDVVKNADKAKALEEAAAESVKLDDGLLAAGDKAETAVTFSVVVNLPADDKEDETDDSLSGTLLTMGSGDDAVILGVDDNKLYFQAGASRITRRLKTDRGQDEEGKDKTVHVVGTFDGKDLRMYTDGSIYKRVDWDPIWVITTVFSVILLAAFALLFKDDVKETAVAAAPAGDVPSEPEGSTEA